MELQLALAQALDVHKDAILTFCQDLVRIASENPPGNHYRECTDRLRVELDRLGLDHRLVEAPVYHDRPRTTSSASTALGSAPYTSTGTTTWCLRKAVSNSTPSCGTGVCTAAARPT